MNITDIFKNYPLDTDSFEYNSHSDMEGGHEARDFPTGGFPPIYICATHKKAANSSDETESEREKTKRGYTTHKTAISIKSILEKRRGITPL